MADNRLLLSLPAALADQLLVDLELIDFARGDYLMRVGELIDFVYFPLDCMVSLVVIVEDGRMVEASTVGNDGFVGLSAFLGKDRAEFAAMVQIAGQALRMEKPLFDNHLQELRFRTALGNYATRSIINMAQSAACLAFHPVQERLARWLLLVRDATQRDELLLTHDFLAIMLGVYRPTVTIAMRTLEAAGLVENRRGRIRIVDQAALTEAACECYLRLKETEVMP